MQHPNPDSDRDHLGWPVRPCSSAWPPMTAREQLAQEIRSSWLIAERDKRRRRIRRRAARRRNLRPVLVGLLLVVLLIIGLWGTTPQMP